MAPSRLSSLFPKGVAKVRRWILAAFVLMGWFSSFLAAQEGAPVFDPYFIGYGTEPDMDSGGRVFVSLGRGVDRLLDTTGPATRHPGLMAIWEIPFGLLFLPVLNHEIIGHGGRGREFGLAPRFGADLDFSAYTKLGHDPTSNVQVAYLALGGTEANQIQALRLQRDYFRPGGAEGATLPMLFFAKLDLSLYVALTPTPASSKFKKQFDAGNDIAVWLVARQAQRANTDPVALWHRELPIDLGDPLLDKNFRAARSVALWNMLDPALAVSAWDYAANHLGNGKLRISPTMITLGEGYGFMVGTHGTLGPSDVSRYLDLYLRTPLGLIRGYARDLDSSVDRTHGGGLGIHDLAIGKAVRVSLESDWWVEPQSTETSAQPFTGWNASAQVDVLFGKARAGHPQGGFSVTAGRKSRGFFPGRPVEAGNYGSFGFLLRF